MNSCELIAFISSISCTLYKTISKKEIVNLATILTQLSVTLSTMLAHDELCQATNGSDVENESASSVGNAEEGEVLVDEDESSAEDDFYFGDVPLDYI